MDAPAPEQVIVVGSDGLGVRVVEELFRAGAPATVVAEAPSRFDDEIQAAGGRVVLGDPADLDTLVEAGVERASAVVLTGEDDVRNLQVALAARERNPKLRVVLRAFEVGFEDRLAALVGGESPVVLSVSALAAPAIAEAALRGDRPPRGGRHRPDGPRAAVWRGVGAVMRHLLADRRLHWFVGILAAITIGATAVFAAAKDLDPVAALYFTVTTLTTTGYGDINVGSDSSWLQVLDILLQVLGVVAVAVPVALFADALVRTRLSEIIGGPPPRPPRGHYVVCGLGTVGYRVAERLVAAGRQVVAIERDGGSTFVGAARRLGVHVMVADASRAEVLGAVSVETAQAVLAVTSDDAANIATALAVRSRSADVRLVVRVFDPALAARLSATSGGSTCLSTSEIAAPVFARAALMGAR